MVQYLTQEWLEAVRKQVDADAPALAQEFKGIDSSLKNVIRGAPDGQTKVLVYRWQDGRLTEARLGTEAELAGERTEFTATGDYAAFAAMNRGESDIKTAVMRKQLRLDGNLLKALRLAKPLDVFNSVVRKVPAEY